MANERNIGKITINGTSLPIVGSPYIGTNGNWWVWDTNLQIYEDSGYSAVTNGNQGVQGVGIHPSDVEVITAGQDAGKIQFTLYDPATNTQQYIKTTNSVQGVGIGSVSIADRRLHITFIDPKTGVEPVGIPLPFTTSTTVIPKVDRGDTSVPASDRDDRQFTLEVGGTTYTSPILQGIGVDASTDAVINNDGTLTIPLFNPGDTTWHGDITTDKTIQGVGVSNVEISNRQFVFTLTNPITSGTSTITVDDNVIPVFSWGEAGTANEYKLKVNVADTDVWSPSLKGIQGDQGVSITGVSVDTESVNPGTLTVTVYDPSTGHSHDITATGRVWGPQGYQGKGISGISITSDNRITLTIHDPSDGSDTTITSPDTITAVGTGIQMSTTDATTVQSAITTNKTAIGTLSNLSTSAKTDLVSAINELYATSPIHVATAAPTSSATDVQKRKLWVNTSTGISYIWTGNAWLALGAVWK